MLSTDNTPFEKAKRPHLYGLEFLRKLAPEAYWRFFVDGKKQLEESVAQFEAREPGCIRAFLNAFYFAIAQLQTDNPSATAHLMAAVHQYATHNVSGNLWVESSWSGRCRNRIIGEIRIYAEHCTPRGIAQLNAYISEIPKYSIEKVTFPALKISRNPALANQNDHPSEVVFNEMCSSNAFLLFTPLFEGEIMDIEVHFIKIISEYLEQPDTLSDSERILSIVRCIQKLERLHPFIDGNTRTFTGIMLNFLLIQQGFPPALFYNPNISYGYADDELAAVVEEGMRRTLYLIDHPESLLFNLASTIQQDDYPTWTFDPMDPENFQPHFTRIRAYLHEKGASLELFRAAEYGDINPFNELDASAYAAHGLIRQLAPDGSDPLFKGRSVFHIACYTNQMQLIQYLLKKDPTLVFLKDRYGQSGLTYAIRAKHTKLLTYLLSASCALDPQRNFLLQTNSSLLEKAIHSGHLDMIKELIALYQQHPPSDIIKTLTLRWPSICHSAHLELNWTCFLLAVGYNHSELMSYYLTQDEKLIPLIFSESSTLFKFACDRKADRSFLALLKEMPHTKLLEVKNIINAPNFKNFLLMHPSCVIETLQHLSKNGYGFKGFSFENYQLAIARNCQDDSVLLAMIEQQSLELFPSDRENTTNLLHLLILHGRYYAVKKTLQKITDAKICDSLFFTKKLESPFEFISGALEISTQQGLICLIVKYCKMPQDIELKRNTIFNLLSQEYPADGFESLKLVLANDAILLLYKTNVLTIENLFQLIPARRSPRLFEKSNQEMSPAQSIEETMTILLETMLDEDKIDALAKGILSSEELFQEALDKATKPTENPTLSQPLHGDS